MASHTAVVADVKVVALLLDRAGEVVTREELRNRLWPADVVVEFENNLNTAVARLREALNDSPEGPRFIETLPRRGYRFVAEVVRALEPAVRKLRIAVLPFENLGGDPGQEYFVDGVTEELITQLAPVVPARLGVIGRTTAMRLDKEGCPACHRNVVVPRNRCRPAGALRHRLHPPDDLVGGIYRAPP